MPAAIPGTGRLEDLTGARNASTPQVFRARAERSGERTFVKWAGAPGPKGAPGPESRTWSYAEAWEAIRRWAGFLRGLGAGPGPDGSRVAGYLHNRPETLWALLGTHAAGSIHVALNRRHKGAILADHLRRSRARILITEASALDSIPDLADTGVRALVVVDRATGPDWIGGGEALRSPPWTGPDPAPGDPATIMFTSGTTGRSKAAVIPHNQLCRGAANLAEAVGMTPDDVFHAWLPLFHIAGQLHTTMCTAVAGGTLGLVPRFSASRFWTEVRSCRATVITGLPAIARILWEKPVTADERAATEHLRLGVFGPMTPELHRPLEERLGIRIADTYGMTEAEPLTVPVPGVTQPVGSCGVPAPDFEIRIAAEDGAALPPGERGEIVARPRRPDVLFLGYEGDEEATRAAWQNGWFRTGDLAHQDEQGWVYYVDRLAHFIRRRGENVSAWELQRLIEEHPAVAEAFVLGVPSPMGEEDVKAVVVPSRGARLDPAALHAWCRGRMAAFMVPRFIEVRDEMPHISVGKVDKDRLRGVGAGVWEAPG